MIRIRILQSYSSFGAHDTCFPNEYVRTVGTSFRRCAAIDKLHHFGIRTENENLVGCFYLSTFLPVGPHKSAVLQASRTICTYDKPKFRSSRVPSVRVRACACAKYGYELPLEIFPDFSF